MSRPRFVAAFLTLALWATPALAGSIAKPLAFARGASEATVSGAAARGESVRYELGARAGQRMSVVVTAAEQNAVFQIYAPGFKVGPDGVTGKTLAGAGEGEDAQKWAGRLPASGTYAIVVGPTRGSATYKLTVGIR